MKFLYGKFSRFIAKVFCSLFSKKQINGDQKSLARARQELEKVEQLSEVCLIIFFVKFSINLSMF